MNEIIKNIEAAQLKENAPEFHVGDTVKVYGKIKEGNRERIQVFEGTVLKSTSAFGSVFGFQFFTSTGFFVSPFGR